MLLWKWHDYCFSIQWSGEAQFDFLWWRGTLFVAGSLFFVCTCGEGYHKTIAGENVVCLIQPVVVIWSGEPTSIDGSTPIMGIIQNVELQKTDGQERIAGLRRCEEGVWLDRRRKMAWQGGIIASHTSAICEMGKGRGKNRYTIFTCVAELESMRKQKERQVRSATAFNRTMI